MSVSRKCCYFPLSLGLYSDIERKCVYQILHVLHSYIKLNVNQSLVCMGKWLSLTRTNMTAWRWTQIGCTMTNQTLFSSYKDWEVHSSSRSNHNEKLLSWGTHKMLHISMFLSLTFETKCIMSFNDPA